MSMQEVLPLPAGYIDENGVVQLIPREFWHGVDERLSAICDHDSCLTKYYRKKLARLLNRKLPRKVRIVVSEQHLQAILRDLEAEDAG